MQQSEQETLTGIYADSILYNAIEQEYMDGDWGDKQTFCAAYKKNKDGLAEKIQHAANDAIWRTEEKHRKAMAENSALVQKLHEEKNALSEELADREKYCEMLRSDLETKNTVETLESFTSTETHIISALRQMIRDDFSKEEIGAAAIFADYLLTEMALTETEDNHD